MFFQWYSGEIMSTFRVGDDIVIDSNNRSVRKNNLKLNLSELTYRLLLVLVENAPHTVSHDRLFEAVWQGKIVSDENLKKRISRLRYALSDAASSYSYIISERGTGYRLIAPVKVFSEKIVKPKAQDKKKLLLFPLRSYKYKFLTYALIGLSIIGLLELTKILMNNEISSPPIGKTPTATAYGYAHDATQSYFQFDYANNSNALTLYKKAIDLSPSFSSAYAGLANAYSQGYYQFGQGEDGIQKALDLSMRAIEIDPKQPWGYKSLGLALYLSGRFDESIKAFKKASKIAPNWGVPISYTALVHLDAGKLILAHQNAKEAVQRDPSNPVTNVNLSLSYRELGMFESSRKILEKLFELNPDFLLAHTYLAEISLATGKYSEAQISIKNSLKIAPNNQSSQWIQSLLKLQTGSLDSAISSFKRTAQLGGRYQLPAKVYLALINKDEHQLEQLYQQLNRKIIKGNQWAELIFCKALISLTKDNSSIALREFEQAINAGMNHGYRFKLSPLLLSVTTNPELKRLIDELELKNSQQRQKVIQLEQLNQEI